ncbi:MAG: extracellular solute-binding protein [Spirochaetales bacterium]|nr:extracellular solute-binding protein [Spirochaetales bacterium]
MFRSKCLLSVCLAFFSVVILSPCAAQDNAPVTIDFWHLDIRDEHQTVWRDICDDFMKSHPNVAIRITVLENEAFKSKLATVMQAGTPPDIFRSWGGNCMIPYAEAGLLRDISEEYATWPVRISATDVFRYKGKLYGLPYDMGCVGMWYNKELLERAGYTSFPPTWDGFLELVRKLKEAGITPIALGEGDKWPGHFWWVYLAMRIGGRAAFDRVISGEGFFYDETWVRAGEMLKELVDLQPFQKGFLADHYDSAEALMGDGEAAMTLMGHWSPGVSAACSRDKRGLGDKMGFASFPAVEYGAGAITDCMGGGNGLVLGGDAPDEAVEFLKYLTSAEIQTRIASSRLGGIPTVPGAEAALDDPNLAAVAEAVAAAGYLQLYYDQYLPPPVGTAILDGTQLMFAGKITPEQCARMVGEAYERSLTNE